MKISLGLVTALLGTAFAVSATTEGSAQLGRAGSVSKQLDEDSKGGASESERAKARDGRTRRRPQGRDRAGTGQDAALRRFDTDRDGKLSEQERAEMRRSWQDMLRRQGKKGPPNGRPGPQDRARLLQRFDKDKDGRLNREERATAARAREEFMKRRELPGRRRQPGRPSTVDKPDRSRVDKSELVGRFDKDGDGKLNSAERVTALKAFQQRNR